MKKISVQTMRSIIFALIGATIGLIYYFVFACSSGCPITSNPIYTALYVAVIAWLISQLF